MKKYVNKISGAELTEKEYKNLLIREYTEQWEEPEEYQSTIVYEFKEDGKTLNDYINYMMANDIDLDFDIIEE